MQDIILSNSHIILEPVSMDAWTDFHEYSVHPDLYEFLEFEPFQSIRDSQAYLEKLIARSESDESQYWFIRLCVEDKIVGSIGVHSMDLVRKTVEIGYGLSPDYWGRGIFSMTAYLIIEYIFTTLKLHRIVARTASENYQSIRGLKKLGFHIEGVMRDYYKFSDGSWHDATLMSLLSTDQMN